MSKKQLAAAKGQLRDLLNTPIEGGDKFGSKSNSYLSTKKRNKQLNNDNSILKSKKSRGLFVYAK